MKTRRRAVSFVIVSLLSLSQLKPTLADPNSNSGHPSSSSTGTPPELTLEKLKMGNSRFVSGKAQSCAESTAQRKELTQSQSPGAIILSCSDSRVPPELIFDQGLGEIFAIRVAGNVLTHETIASIEYAISHLGSRLVVVMGHDSCGAIRAAIETPKGANAGSPELNILVSEIQENLGSERTESHTSDPTLRGPVRKNVSSVAFELPNRSKIVKEALDSGRVKIVRGIYTLSTGKVEFLD